MIFVHFTVFYIYSTNSSGVSLYRLQGFELPSSGLSTKVQWGWSLGFGWATQGHSENWSHSSIVSAVCFGSLSCWKLILQNIELLCALWCRFSSRISLYLTVFIFLSILTSLSVPAAEKYLNSMMPAPPCFTIGMVLANWWAEPSFSQT